MTEMQEIENRLYEIEELENEIDALPWWRLIRRLQINDRLAELEAREDPYWSYGGAAETVAVMERERMRPPFTTPNDRPSYAERMVEMTGEEPPEWDAPRPSRLAAFFEGYDPIEWWYDAMWASASSSRSVRSNTSSPMRMNPTMTQATPT